MRCFELKIYGTQLTDISDKFSENNIEGYKEARMKWFFQTVLKIFVIVQLKMDTLRELVKANESQWEL